MKYTVTFIQDRGLHEDTLTSIWSRNNLHAGRDPGDKYRWFYVGAPAGDATAFFLAHASDTGGDTYVGCCGLGYRRLSIDGHSVDAGLFADFAVDEAHRTLLPALTLQRALCADAQSRFPLTYGFPNAAAVGVFQRIGFPLLGKMGRFVRVLRHRTYVERYVPLQIVSRPAGAIIDTAVHLRDRVKLRQWPPRHTLQWADAPDARFDALFERVRRSYRFIGERTAAFLRWRFVQRPGARSQFATLVDSAGGLTAYGVVMQKHDGSVLLADFLSDDAATLAELVHRIVVDLQRRRILNLTAFFLGAPAIGAVLEAQGFGRRESSKFVVVGTGNGLTVAKDQVMNVDSWYLTEADRDN